MWTFEPQASQAAIDRFRETGGPPPEGVTMVTRYHDVAGRRGFALAESNDAVAVSKWCHRWNDLVKFEVIPVVDDEELGSVLAERG